MSQQDHKKPITDKRTSRRTFIKNSGLTVGGVVLGGALGSLLVDKEVPTQVQQVKHEPVANPNVALMFLTPQQYKLTQHAAERIYPADENGPGALELNAAIYIDHQLAGPYGINAKDYRLGAFHNAQPTQQRQIKILRKDLFLIGLKALDDYSLKNYEKGFVELEAAEQDEVLTAFNEDKVELTGKVPSSEFFSLLRKLTIEGVYADPLYGGNNNMDGWAMRKYPGSRMAYVKEIQSDEFIELKPQGLNSHMGH